MKKLTALALGVALILGLATGAQAAQPMDDMSWWGNTGATPMPVEDHMGRSGYWWWPTEPASNVDDMEIWGNAGCVYGPWSPPVAETPAPPVEEPVDPGRTVPVLSNVLFDFDKAVLKPEGKRATDAVINEMKTYGGDVVLIEGHTCDIGSEQYNMGLGQRRADAVKSYMVQNGIAPERISTVSFGETQPAVPNTSPANRKLNRRAVFELTISN